LNSQLPAGFFRRFRKEKPSLLVKSVLAAVFSGQHGKDTWQSVLTTGLPLFFAIWQPHNSRAKGGRICSLAPDCHHIPSASEREWKTGKLRNSLLINFGEKASRGEVNGNSQTAREAESSLSLSCFPELIHQSRP